MELAPIVLFVYKRPVHTRNVLESLMANQLADRSLLYIYSDGPKENVSEDDIHHINETRKILRENRWCKEVYIIESEKNIGLANSVIKGVTQVVNDRHGKIIVLEDDIITSAYFLKYMNEALSKYENAEKIMQISGHSFPASNIKRENSSFFLPFTTTWGWATWKRAWDKFDIAAKGYEILKTDKELENKFNLDDSYPYSRLLFRQMETREVDSWGIRWWWSVFRNEGLTLFPDKSLIDNIGFHSGTHTSGANPFPLPDFDRNYFISRFPEQIEVNKKYFNETKAYIYNALNKRERSKVRTKIIALVKKINRIF